MKKTINIHIAKLGDIKKANKQLKKMKKLIASLPKEIVLNVKTKTN